MDIIDFYRAVAEGDIKKVKKFYFNNISLNEILVIGGNDSEYELISNIPNNYVVSNSNDKLKKIAKKKTTSNNEHGVEKVLKRI